MKIYRNFGDFEVGEPIGLDEVRNDLLEFRGNKMFYECAWADDLTFQLDFGDGQLKDKDGDLYFIHCEYHKDKKKFFFEAWYEEGLISLGADNELIRPYLTEEEKEGLMGLMQEKMGLKKRSLWMKRWRKPEE